jgi:hypothetical protein
VDRVARRRVRIRWSEVSGTEAVAIMGLDAGEGAIGGILDRGARSRRTGLGRK